MSSRSTINWINNLREQGLSWKSIASELYQDAPTESAAVGRLYRFRQAIKEERFDSRVVGKAVDAFETTSDAVIPSSIWGGTKVALREDKMSFEELIYLRETGRSDTKLRAEKLIKKWEELTGKSRFELESENLIIDRPLVSKYVAKKRISYRFGRGKSDIQRMRVAKQLREKGINWSSEYADFAGYGGL